MTNREIATKIYEKLLEKGAGIGNASIPFIKKVLDESIPVDKPVKPEIAELTDKENENYIDHYIDMGHFADPVKARPYLLDGFYHGYNYLKKKIEKQFSV